MTKKFADMLMEEIESIAGAKQAFAADLTNVSLAEAAKSIEAKDEHFKAVVEELGASEEDVKEPWFVRAVADHLIENEVVKPEEENEEEEEKVEENEEEEEKVEENEEENGEKRDETDPDSDEEEEEDEITVQESEEFLAEMSRRKAAVIGGIVGGVPGALIGAAFAKGKQRTLMDQIDKGKKKIQKWRQDDPKKNKEKIDRMQKKIVTWQKHLSYLKSAGKGDSGIFRKSAAEKEAEKAKKGEKK